MFVSCAKNNSKTNVFWVNSFTSECSNNSGKQCVSISKEDLNNPKWIQIQTGIKGFDFETGYFQKIEVKEKILNKSKVTANTDLVKYTLVKVLEKKIDNSVKLNDVWVCTHINGKKIEKTLTTPRLEINVAKMKLFGNNGCNDYTGKINSLNNFSFKTGVLASTKKMCLQMDVPNKFDAALKKAVKYKLENLKLVLLDAYGKETLSFIKVD